jgi:hypothetical protein
MEDGTQMGLARRTREFLNPAPYLLVRRHATPPRAGQRQRFVGVAVELTTSQPQPGCRHLTSSPVGSVRTPHPPRLR